MTRTIAVLGTLALSLGACVPLDDAEPGDQPVTSTDESKLDVFAQIRLRVICSPWLYVGQVTEFDKNKWRNDPTKSSFNITDRNNLLCDHEAESLTISLNALFTNSGLPARFTYTSQVLSGGGDTVVGRRFNNYQTVIDTINSGDFPDLRATTVSTVVRVDTSTCNPFGDPANPCDSHVVHHCSGAGADRKCYNAAGGTMYSYAAWWPYAYDTRSFYDTVPFLVDRYTNDANTITVGIRYARVPETAGLAYGLWDRTSQKLTDLRHQTPSQTVALDGSNYMARLGYVAVRAFANLYVGPHEIGHVFGALHERPAVQAHPFYAEAGLASKAQFAYVRSQDHMSVRTTVMASRSELPGRLHFSTPEPSLLAACRCWVNYLGVTTGPCPGVVPVSPGNDVTDNRTYIIELLQHLYGNNLTPYPPVVADSQDGEVIGSCSRGPR